MTSSPVSALLRNASLLMSGTFVAQLVTFFLSFVLARLYEPHQFGRYSIFMGCAGVLAAAGTGAYDRVILLARSSGEARRVATLTLAASGSASLLVLSVGSALVAIFPSPNMLLPLIDVAVFLPVFMIAYAAAQIFIYSSLREDRARLLSVLKMVQSCVMGAVQLAAAGLTAVSGLVLGNVIGWLVMAFAGLRWRWRQGALRSDFRIGSLASVARKHVRFPRYIMPNEVIDNLSNQAPLLLIGAFMSLSDAGHYGLAIMILSAPSAVIGQAVGQSFLQFLGSQPPEPERILSLMYRVWAGMAAVAVIPFGVVFIDGGRVFSIAFGANWTAAGKVAEALSLLLFVRFVSSPTSTVYLKLGMQREQWYFCLAAAAYRTAAYSLAFFGFSLEAVIWVHAVAEITFIALYNFAAVRRLRLGSTHNSLTA